MVARVEYVETAMFDGLMRFGKRLEAKVEVQPADIYLQIVPHYVYYRRNFAKFYTCLFMVLFQISSGWTFKYKGEFVNVNMELHVLKTEMFDVCNKGELKGELWDYKRT